MEEFIKHIKKDLVNNCFYVRQAANTALLAYDLGRANTEAERNNARKEWEFRMFAFECRYGIKEAMRVTSRFNSR